MLSSKNKVRMMSVLVILAMLFSFASVSPAAAQDETPPAMPGITEGTGTFFEVTNSDYLNVTVTSTAEINLYLNSAPKIINMRIDAASTATSTDITLGGLEANTTYWKYQDASVDGVQFTTDAAGRSTVTYCGTMISCTVSRTSTSWAAPVLGCVSSLRRSAQR